jgi:hypothetical protein
MTLDPSTRCAPDKMFEMAGGSLPFGCHAWEHYGKAFWLEALGEDYFATNLILKDNN